MWSSASALSLTWLESATVGDTMTFDWYGTDLSINFIKGVPYGMFSYATDGAAAVAQGCYLNVGDSSNRLRIAKDLTSR